MKLHHLLASLLIVFSLAHFVSAEFVDVDSSHQYSEAIEYVEALNIIEGYADNTFQPENTINRAEFIKIIVESKYSSEEISGCDLAIYSLVDVANDSWFATHVCVALEEGMVNGYSDNTYKGGDEINFVEASKIISLSQGLELESSEDPWYKAYVTYLGEEQAIPLDIDSFDQLITRGEMVEMMFRLLTDEKDEVSQTYDSLLNGDSLVVEDSSVIENSCGHDLDPYLVSFGYNTVLDEDLNVLSAQGSPIQESYTLGLSASYVEDHNSREYAQVFAHMAPIRDALMCDVESVSLEAWAELTDVLVRNDIKATQDLSGTPQDHVYSVDGIYEHLSGGEDFHPMMKFLEEAELELKCLAFEDFNFVNPEGDNHCEIHGIEVGSGIQ
jgi:hypothetical protein